MKRFFSALQLPQLLSLLLSFLFLVSFTGSVHAGVTAGAIEKESSKADKSKVANSRYENIELFQRVLQFIEKNYVEEVKNEDLIHGAVKGMLDTLDPHSNFLPPKIFKEMKEETSGKFGGIGIELGKKDDLLTILAPIEDTPAWKAGIKSGDRIIKINGESTKGMDLSEAVSKMRGDRNTKIELTIYRKSGFTSGNINSNIKSFTLKRDEIKLDPVKFELLEPQIGYVRLSSFNESAAEDISKAISKLEKNQKLKGLVLDLRTNPGGLLNQAVDVTSLFVDEGVVVSTIPRNKEQKEIRYAKEGKARKDFQVAVLVNNVTASAAEIVAGALQDHQRAIILGQPTFGKGSVQQVIDLGQEMGLKLTIARYYTPSGRNIQEKGIMPDILLEDYDPKLLSEARKKSEYSREKDLKRHFTNESKSGEGSITSGSEYTTEELEVSSSDKQKTDGINITKTDSPDKISPKDDFQVKEAVNYLKSYDLFQKISKQKTRSNNT